MVSLMAACVHWVSVHGPCSAGFVRTHGVCSDPCREGCQWEGGVQGQSFKVALLHLSFKLVYPQDCSEERGQNVQKV